MGQEQSEWLAESFEEQRPRLRAVAYRVLGSAAEADDAVQEAWLRASRGLTGDVENLSAWLTTIVARVSLNMLRSRRTRAEQPPPEDPVVARLPGPDDPADQAVLADSVGLALLVVLDTLTPAERLAFVLHDLFDVPFEEIAPIVGRSGQATRQLASRARRRVRGRGDDVRSTDVVRQRRVVDAYLAAIREGDLEGLVRLLDPDVVITADPAILPSGRPTTLRGVDAVAQGAIASSRRAKHGAPALIDGSVGIVVAPRGHLWMVLTFAFDGDRITAIDVVADSERLAALDLSVLDG